MPLNGGEAYPVRTWLSSWNCARHRHTFASFLQSTLGTEEAEGGYHAQSVLGQYLHRCCLDFEDLTLEVCLSLCCSRNHALESLLLHGHLFLMHAFQMESSAANRNYE